MATFRNENASHVVSMKQLPAAVIRRPLGDRTNLAPAPIVLGKAEPKAVATATVLAASARSGGTIRAVAAQVPGARGRLAIEPMTTPAARQRTAGAAEDIDAEGVNDPQAVSEYAEDIMKHFRQKELNYLPPSDYMTMQPDINPRMRAILIDWLVEVHLKFKLSQETLFLCVNVIDRFLAKHQQQRKALQLVGITSLLIASKYEEIHAPEVRDCLYICDQAYEKHEVLAMERLILATLDFNLLHPYPLHFLRRFSSAVKADINVHTLAKYLIELTLPDYDCIRYLSSTIAAASLLLALKMCGRHDAWDATMEWHTRYTEAQLLPAMQHINDLHARADVAALKAVKKKYSKSKFLSVAKMPALAISS